MQKSSRKVVDLGVPPGPQSLAILTQAIRSNIIILLIAHLNIILSKPINFVLLLICLYVVYKPIYLSFYCSVA